MGTFSINCKIENHSNREQKMIVKKMLVDTGSEYSWISENSLQSIGVQIEKKLFHLKWQMGKSFPEKLGL